MMRTPNKKQLPGPLTKITDIDMRAWDNKPVSHCKVWAFLLGIATCLLIIKTNPPRQPQIIEPAPHIRQEKTATPSASTNPVEVTPTPGLDRVRTSIGNGRWIGYVSHYSRSGCLGCSETLTMANGETLDDTRATIAFNWLPMNTRVRITNTDNGKSMEAIVTDTGGFNKLNRIADLVPAVANYLETKTDKSLVIIEQL